MKNHTNWPQIKEPLTLCDKENGGHFKSKQKFVFKHICEKAPKELTTNKNKVKGIQKLILSNNEIFCEMEKWLRDHRVMMNNAAKGVILTIFWQLTSPIQLFLIFHHYYHLTRTILKKYSSLNLIKHGKDFCSKVIQRIKNNNSQSSKSRLINNPHEEYMFNFVQEKGMCSLWQSLKRSKFTLSSILLTTTVN